MAKRRMINWDAQPLGQVPDSVLANMLNVSRSAVKLQRIKRGIKPTKVGLARDKIRTISDWFMLDYVEGAERCARCGYDRRDLRVDWDDIGFICLECYQHAPSCCYDGCNNIALANGICRSHYVGDTWTREDYRALAEHLGHYGNNNMVYPEPGAGYKKEDFCTLIPSKPNKRDRDG